MSEGQMRREDLGPEERAFLEDLLRQFVRQTNVCEKTGLTEDEAIEAQIDLLEAGLIEILAAPPDDDGSFAFRVVPTAKAPTALRRGR